MQPRVKEVTLTDIVEDGQEALTELQSIDNIEGKIDCLKRIAAAQHAVNTAYDAELEQLTAVIQQPLEELNDKFAPFIEDTAEMRYEAIDIAKNYVLDTGESITDDGWLHISYVKPTFKLKSKEALRGYIVANPEAIELCVDVEATTRVAKWKPSLIDDE